ncbi:MAG: DUF3276 family protein [Ferruginibacter sp.]
MAYENNDKKIESVYSNRVKAGKRRTYFFDVRETRGNDFFLTITESRKRFDTDGYDRHKIFLYKEDFNKFVKGLNEAVDYVKTELMPDFDFDAFNHDNQFEGEEGQQPMAAEPGPVTMSEHVPTESTPEVKQEPKAEQDAEEINKPDNNLHSEEVDKW